MASEPIRLAVFLELSTSERELLLLLPLVRLDRRLVVEDDFLLSANVDWFLIALKFIVAPNSPDVVSPSACFENG